MSMNEHEHAPKQRKQCASAFTFPSPPVAHLQLMPADGSGAPPLSLARIRSGGAQLRLQSGQRGSGQECVGVEERHGGCIGVVGVGRLWGRKKYKLARAEGGGAGWLRLAEAKAGSDGATVGLRPAHARAVVQR